MRIIPTLIFCLFASGLFAQQNAIKAYVVTLKGDTVRGEAQMNPKKPLQHYDKLVFKDLNGVQKNYKADKLKSYCLDKEYYIGFTYDGEPKFYHALVRGSVNLYEVKFEFQQGKEVITESEYFLSQPDNKKMIPVKTAKFKKQLADWTKDKPEIAENYPDDKEFDEKAAIASITEYNTWKAGQ